MHQLVKFFSEFPFFQNEKNLALYLENFLSTQYLIRPLMVLSIQDKFQNIQLDKCRFVLGKANREQFYNIKVLNELIFSNDELKQVPYFVTKDHNGHFYYYLKLGKKRSQFHFTIFSSTIEIEKDVLGYLSNYIAGQFKLLEKFDDLQKGHELIHIDDVTGLYNQRKLYKDLAILVEKFKVENDPFSVLFIDIDHFKKVNDSYGHLIGTKLLEKVASDVKGLLRDSDISYRYGGDEFVVILVDSNAESGKIVGQRILSKICSSNYSVDSRDKQKTIKLSVSIGVAEFPTDAKNANDILTIADRMMYEAKESGRGLVFNTQDVFKTSLKKIFENK